MGDFTREALALVVDRSIGGQRVVRELDDVIARRGRPAMIVSDNGIELTSRAVLEWTNRTGTLWHYIAPGKPTQNALVEAFIGKRTTSAPPVGSMPTPGILVLTPRRRGQDAVLHGPALRRQRQRDARSRAGHRTTSIGERHLGHLCALLVWREEDLVDDAGRRHNDVIFHWQGNRNPFIDHPEWVQSIWRSADT